MTVELFNELQKHYTRNLSNEATTVLQIRVLSLLAGPRPSESTALRHEDLDLTYARARIHRIRVEGQEAGTKTVRSNREIHLHENVVEVLKHENLAPLSVNPEDYFFTTPNGTPIDERNFHKRDGCRS
jgi:integrase